MKSHERVTTELINSDGPHVGPARRKALSIQTLYRTHTLKVKRLVHFYHTPLLPHSCNLENRQLYIYIYVYNF